MQGRKLAIYYVFVVFGMPRPLYALYGCSRLPSSSVMHSSRVAMGKTRYSERFEDGTSAHYDSADALVAAQQARFNDSVQGWFAFGGLVLGVILAYSFTSTVIPDWPKIIRFIIVILSAIGLSVLLARVAVVVFNIAITVLGFGLLIGIGSLIWKAF